jgi:hypothetical protein
MPVEKIQKWCKECECRVAAERLIDRKFSPGGVLGGAILLGTLGALFGAVDERRGKFTCPRCGSTRLTKAKTAKRWCAACGRYVTVERGQSGSSPRRVGSAATVDQRISRTGGDALPEPQYSSPRAW